MAGERKFLVLESQTLVQIDLTQVIRDVCPDATVLTSASVEGAWPLIADLDALEGGILGAPVRELKASGLGARVEELGGWVVCLNGRHTEDIVAEGWSPLARPFSLDDAQAVVRSLVRRGAPIDAE